MVKRALEFYYPYFGFYKYLTLNQQEELRIKLQWKEHMHKVIKNS